VPVAHCKQKQINTKQTKTKHPKKQPTEDHVQEDAIDEVQQVPEVKVVNLYRMKWRI
jgi:hypothetical protein